MFEKASRLKLRFATKFGSLSTEDLWDMGLNDLDEIAVDLSTRVSEGDKSFIKKRTRKNEKENLCFEIVKHIIETKMAEADAAESRLLKKAAKERLAVLIQKKEEEGLEAKSIEDLKKMMDEL